MKKLLFCALLSMAGWASAEGCAQLDYEEMKDMATPELTQTYCSYYQEWQRKLVMAVRWLDDDLSNQARKCEGQVERMRRVLKKREDGTQAIMASCPMSYK